MMTLPEQIQELETKMGNLNADLSAALSARDEAIAAKSKAEGDLAAVSAERAAFEANAVSALGQLATANAEIAQLKAEAKTADQLAIAIMAKVGQPAPLGAQIAPGTGAAASSAAASSDNGLQRTINFFKNLKAA